MDQLNPKNIVKAALGLGGTVLISPVAMPVVHGLAGITLVGLGLFSAGSLIVKAAGSLKGTIIR